MNSAYDVFTPEVAATVRDVVRSITESDASGCDVVYRSQAIPGLAPRLGQAGTPSEQRSMRAWRALNSQRANQTPETATRQYLILCSEFTAGVPIEPAMGDSIVDAGETWGIESIETAEIGEPIHYLFTTRLRRKAG